MSGSTQAVREDNARFIRGAVTYGVLQPVKKNQDPTIVIACGDLGQSPERIGYCYGKVCDQIQWLLLTGGALGLDALSPAGRLLAATVTIVKMIRLAIKAKAKQGIVIKRIVLMGDLLCGVAEECGMTTPAVMHSLVNAKLFLKDQFPGIEVSLKFYLDHPADVLGLDHPLVIEHPEATALTFYFSSKEMADYLVIFEREIAQTVTA